MGRLAGLSSDYQTLLEHHRRDPDDEATYEQMREAYRKLEDAWCELAVEEITG